MTTVDAGGYRSYGRDASDECALKDYTLNQATVLAVDATGLTCVACLPIDLGRQDIICIMRR